MNLLMDILLQFKSDGRAQQTPPPAEVLADLNAVGPIVHAHCSVHGQ